MSDATPDDGNTMERALRAIRDLRARVASLEQGQGVGQDDPVAIIGMGCRFPGAGDLQEFWNLLVEGRDPLGPVPADRWDISALYSRDPQAPGKTITRDGGHLPGLDRFDAAFFGISPREAPFIDPRQRLVLETAWEAIEDAGIPTDRLAGSRTSVIVGTLTNDYNQLITADDRWVSASTGTGTSTSIIANRVSYLLDLHGPSLTVDTACSGSLMALHLAVQTLRNGEASLALCGGVAVNLVPAPDICFSRMGVLSPEGRCRTFDAAASGMARSEGAGMVMLKRLSDALADGDRVYAVIRASAVNHDGRSNGIAAPNGQAQEGLIREACAKAGIGPGRLHYVEAHGTGTVLGDRIELQALSAVLSAGREPGRPLLVGSVKSNIGHTESAAGIAGIIKAALALKHRLLPGNLHLETPHPALAEAPFPMKVPTKTEPFPFPGETLLAGVSAFSFGGANAHVVLEEAPAPRAGGEPAEEGPPLVLALSAASPEALRALASAYVAYLRAPGAPKLADICMTAARRRRHHPHRLAAVARTASELAARLENHLSGGDEPFVVEGEAPAAGRRLAFAFSGQGGQWLGMGRDLHESEPVFRDVIEACDRIFREVAGWSLTGELRASPEASRLEEIDIVQPAIFAVQAALAALLASWNLRPEAVLGQSMGEVAAAHVAGILSLDDAARVILERSRLMRTRSGQGLNAVVGLPASELTDRLAGRLDRIGIAGTTSFTSTLLAGDADTLRALTGELEVEGVFCRLIDNIDVPAHSPVMDDLQPQLVAALHGVAPQPSGAARFLSTVTLRYEGGEGLGAAYWGRNLREPFRVAEAAAAMAREGYDLFVEIGPHPVMVGALRQNLQHEGAEGIALPSLVRGQDGAAAMRRLAGALWAHGGAFDVSALLPAGARCVSLPSYPWQREHFWVDQIAEATGGTAEARQRGGATLLGAHFAPARGGLHGWEQDIDGWTLPWLADHAIRGVPVLPGAAYLEMAAAAARQGLGWDRAEIAEAHFDRMLLLPGGQPQRLQVLLSRIADRAAKVEILSRPAAGGEWTLHARALVHRESAPGGALPAASAPPSEAASVAATDFYARFAEGGLEYGPAFRGVRSLATLGRMVWSEVTLPDEAGQPAAGVHPALLDAAFQTVAAAAIAGEAVRPVYLPRAVRRLVVEAPVTRSCRVCAVLKADSEIGAPVIEADLAMFDGDGRVFLRVEGLQLARVDEIAAAEPALEDALHVLDWQDMPRPDGSAAGDGAWLLIGDAAAETEALAAQIERLGGTAQVARTAAEGVRMMAGIGDGLRGVVQIGAPAREDVPAAVRAGLVESALALVQALVSTASQARLWFVTRGAVAEAPTTPTGLRDAALWGFGHVVAIEHPEIWGGLCDTGATPDWRALAAELAAPAADREIAWRGGRRLVARLDRLPRPEVRPEPVGFRGDASYLVTGGLSGLGLATAHWMAERGARRLILVGRTPLPARRIWAGLDPASAAGQRAEAVRALEAQGVSVHLESFDVADAARLGEFLRSYEEEGFPPIRGVVHAAGIVQDALLLRMTGEDVDAVMQSKVAGAWALHEATRRMPLDFFVLYSSASAVMGQVGQAAYAAANGFEDALARHRRAAGLPALSINWGPWAEIGLFARLGLAERAGLSGVTGITPGQGMQALDRLLALGVPQAMVLNADWALQPASPRLERLQTAPRPAASGEGGEADLAGLLLMGASQRKAELSKAVAGIVAVVLRLDASRLDPMRPLTAFGMDSIMAVEIRNRLRRRFDVQLTMVELFTGTVARLAEGLDQALARNDRLAALLDEIESLPAEAVEALLEIPEGAARP